MKVADILTSPDTPKYLRLPGLVCLVRAWLLFSVVILQVANLWPTDDGSPWLHNTIHGRLFNRFGHWAGGMEMGQACWQVFLSVCAGLVCGGLANGLDRGWVKFHLVYQMVLICRRRRDVAAGFNLVSGQGLLGRTGAYELVWILLLASSILFAVDTSPATACRQSW